MSPYEVNLMNWPDLPLHERIAAEVRYATVLERIFGSPDQVNIAWWDDFAAAEYHDEVAPDEPRIASAWQLAEREAAAAGWQGLDHRPPRAFFRVIVDGADSTYEGFAGRGAFAATSSRAS